MHRKKWPIRSLLDVATLMATFYSCTSMECPDGGSFDETPPRFIDNAPAAGAVNNKKLKIVFDFDEFIKFGKANERVVVLPPQLQQPEMKSGEKQVIVSLLDSLGPSTTYTTDFSDTIADNNEGNSLDNFALTFSMGASIDTMGVSGILLETSDLEPIKGMLVRFHSNLNDSAFIKLPFDRVTHADSRGYFTIRGVVPNKHRIFGLVDAGQGFFYSQKAEAVAFNDSLIIPRLKGRIRQDTTWADSLTIDTIVEWKYTYYLPDNIVLRSLKTPSVSQHLIKSEHLTPQKFSSYFSAPVDSSPVLRGLNFDEKDAFTIEKMFRNGTIRYWIHDPLLYKQNTPMLNLNYLCTDMLSQLVPRTDTLRSAAGKMRKEEPKRKKRKDDKPRPTKFSPVNTHAPSFMDVFDCVTLVFEEPVACFDSAAIRLRQKINTIWTDVSSKFEHDSLGVRHYDLYYNWEPEGGYEFTAGSTTFHGIYGLSTNKVKQVLKVRQIEEYDNVFLNITGVDSIASAGLLDNQDKAPRRRPTVDGRTEFYYLNPGKYEARLINNASGNGIQGPSNYEKGVRPEVVCYYPHIIGFEANWGATQDWDMTTVSLDKQEPDKLKGQKLDEDRKKRTRDNRNANRNRRNN